MVLPKYLEDKLEIIPEAGCWLGTCSLNSRGYAQIWWGGRNEYLHRVVWGILVGEIPKDKELHHKCRVKCCCNPNHMELVSRGRHLVVEPRGGGGQRKRKKGRNLDVDYIVRLREEGLTQQDIANKLGCSQWTISNRLWESNG